MAWHRRSVAGGPNRPVVTAGPCNVAAATLNGRLGGSAFSCYDYNATGLNYLVVAATECDASASVLHAAMPLTSLMYS